MDPNKKIYNFYPMKLSMPQFISNKLFHTVIKNNSERILRMKKTREWSPLPAACPFYKFLKMKLYSKKVKLHSNRVFFPIGVKIPFQVILKCNFLFNIIVSLDIFTLLRANFTS